MLYYKIAEIEEEAPNGTLHPAFNVTVYLGIFDRTIELVTVTTSNLDHAEFAGKALLAEIKREVE